MSPRPPLCWPLSSAPQDHAVDHLAAAQFGHGAVAALAELLGVVAAGVALRADFVWGALDLEEEELSVGPQVGRLLSLLTCSMKATKFLSERLSSMDSSTSWEQSPHSLKLSSCDFILATGGEEGGRDGRRLACCLKRTKEDSIPRG